MRTPLLALVGTLAAVVTTLAAVPAEAASGPVRVVRWSDGDTVVTTHGTIRLVGVDTPERGRCGYTTATQIANRIAPPGAVLKVTDPRTVQDRDRYGRLLRYVKRGKRDIGAVQIKRGSVARYDARDGYQWHAKQARYRKLDARHRNYRCTTAAPVSGSVAPAGRSCPSWAPIKGNASSMIYHRPGQQYYAVTVPEACFRNAASAEAAGYRAAKV